ncbi:SoxR reducing system RseC family protein [Spongiibacter sp. KMU-158]|uniref:SoxR reducing system RseC family protein n=1 Tax=Spongiibacter pelagi TaxID=2760804 RepID=A0A927C2G7_9GAMM|nr:SoxR reducing system RseC family protein [Spongiibacter pelagi]MBD2858576.1 SoxR reducing system RseC family protein [Spongiibacter pelagi]
MIVETGRVVAIEQQALWIETIQKSTCGSCTAKNGCGQGLMNRVMDGRRNQLKVPLGEFSAADFAIDDRVEMGVEESTLLSGALMVYLLPLFSMIAGMGLISQWDSRDGIAALGAALGFVFGLLVLRVYNRWLERRGRAQTVLLGRCRAAGVQTLDFQH